MISYLKGTVASIIKSSGNRVILLLEVNSCGYEMQIPARLAQEITAGEQRQIFTHLQVREEQPSLYGFGSSVQRDLFRLLISVSGIGAALAIALLDTLDLADLVQAIVSNNTQLLLQTPGVGGKTAERICLELKSKLVSWSQTVGLATTTAAVPLAPNILEEVQAGLLAVGYSPSEISQALTAVSQNALVPKNANPEEWMRQAMTWLSSQ
jgi:holliday junction DNA helicase RuvA